MPHTPKSQPPYWRLSGFYLFYFASLGALIPFWGLYLKHLGYDASDIGVMMGVILGTKIISPNIWGWIADHTGKRMAIVRFGSLAAAVMFAGVLFHQGYWWLFMVMLAFSFFWNAALPQFEATTFTHLGEQTHRYSSIRLWGSIGFIIAVWGLGLVLDETGMQIFPWVLLVLFAGIWVFSLLVPENAAGHLPLAHEPLKQVLKKPHVFGLLVACFLMQASHGPYYTFYSIYMQEYQYDLDFIGFLWALGVIAEVAIFIVMHKLVPRYGLRYLLILSLWLAALRWLIIGLFPQYTWVMVLSQLFHAATFGIYHAVAIQLIHIYFSGRHQGKGQALYSSLSFGAGGAVGSFYSGYTWELFGGNLTFLIAVVLPVIAIAVVTKTIPKKH